MLDIRLPYVLPTLAALFCSLPAYAELRPSEAVTLMVQAMQTQPDAQRTSLTRPIIERMTSEDLSDTELFFKGEAHFLNFEPEPARDAYWELRDRSDNIGRVSAQRLMTIRVNAFGMIDEVLENDLPRYRERFGVRPYDRYGVTYAVSRAARQLADRGEPDRALDIVADEVHRHDRFDAPYMAYELPAQFMELAARQGRAEEFHRLLAWVTDGLEAARANEPRPGPAAAVEALPGTGIFSLFADRRYDDYLWSAEFERLRAKLGNEGSPGD